MYPYYYPSFFNPSKMSMAGMGTPGMGMTGMGTPGMGMVMPGMGSGMGNIGAATGGVTPDMTDTGFTGGTIAGPGTTAGMPVTPAAPPPITMEPSPVDFTQQPGPPVTTDIGYTQAYLKTQIGQRVRVEFLIGTNTFIDRTGILLDVGISYIIIKPVGTDDRMLCDMYSIKFVTFLA